MLKDMCAERRTQKRQEKFAIPLRILALIATVGIMYGLMRLLPRRVLRPPLRVKAIISTVNKPIHVYNRPEQDYDQIFTCLLDGYTLVNADLEGMGGKTTSDDEKLKESCRFFKIVGKCLVEAAKNSTHPVPKILVYSVYYGWQHLVMLHKANLCLDVPFSELKNVANSPGFKEVTDQANLKNVEEVTYEPCVGQIMRDCFIEQAALFEGGDRKSPNFLYTECFETKAEDADPGLTYNCKNSTMIRHFLKQGETIETEWDTIQE